MANEPLMSDAVDPLQGFFGISLFPRTIRASADAALPSDTKDLDSIHHFMKSLKMSSPERVLDEAKAIVNGGSELLNFEFAKFAQSLEMDKDAVASERVLDEAKATVNGVSELMNSEFAKFAQSSEIDKDAVALQGKEKPQERRPGLGRKRARFSLKPNTSEPPSSLEPSLDIDQLQDPEDFFSALEKLENARREIQKQKGVAPSDLNVHNTRPRRPGILRKSASYKHRYSSLLLESVDMLTSSQETSQQVVQGESGHESQEETNIADVEMEDIDAVGSKTNTDNRVNEILDELLSRDVKDLDEDWALSCLQERLQIKPIDLGNLSIPEFQGIGRTDFKALGERLPKGRKSVSDMSNLVKLLSGQTPKRYKEGAENPITPTASPTPPRSPFPSLSLLKIRSSQSSQLRDPFLPLNVDLVEDENTFSVEDIDKQSDKVEVLKVLSMSGGSRSELEDETNRPSGSGANIHTQESRHPDSLIDDSVDNKLDEQIRDIDTRPNESQMDLQDQSGGNEIHRKTTDCDTVRDIETSRLAKGPHQLAENTGDMFKGTLSSEETYLNADDSAKSGSNLDIHIYHSSQVEEVEDMLSEAAVPAESPNSARQNMNQNQLHSDQLASTASEEDAADMPSGVVETDPAQTTELREQTHLSQKQQHNEKRPRVGSRESKAFVLRPSLAAAGTSFESGVRRSKRIRMRPLEYWKGERFLYGRIDKSLKLVGVKYASPSKGDGSLTVKSYVPDEYKEILQLAAHY